jgi:hypothetical protein
MYLMNLLFLTVYAEKAFAAPFEDLFRKTVLSLYAPRQVPDRMLKLQ